MTSTGTKRLSKLQRSQKLWLEDRQKWLDKQPAWVYRLYQIGACPDALFYAERCKSLKTAWQSCTRPDWMYWLLRKRLAGLTGPHHTAKLIKLGTEFQRRFIYSPHSGFFRRADCSLQSRRRCCRFIRDAYPTIALPRKRKQKKGA